MANELRQGKNLGNEKLTRPEEVAALSKYLKHIKEVQEEHTEFNEDVLILARKDDETSFKEVDSLSDYLDQLDSDNIDLQNLPEDSIKIEATDSVDNLETKVERIEGDLLSPELDTSKEILEDAIKNLTLEKFTEDLGGDIKELSLGDFVESLSGNIKNLPLEDFVERLGGDINQLKLEDEVSKLIKGAKDLPLSDFVEKFSGEVHDLALTDFIENLGGTIKDVALGDFVEKMGGTINDLGLENFRTRIIGIVDTINKLEDEQVGILGTISPLELDGHRERIISQPEDLELYDKILEEAEFDDTKLIDILKLGTEEEKLKLLEAARECSVNSEEYYKKAMRLLKCSAKVLDAFVGDSAWVKKIETTLSTYASSSVQRGAFERGEQELSKTLIYLLKSLKESANSLENKKIKRPVGPPPKESLYEENNKQHYTIPTNNTERDVTTTDEEFSSAFDKVYDDSTRKYRIPETTTPWRRVFGDTVDWSKLTDENKSKSDVLNTIDVGLSKLDSITDVSGYLRHAAEKSIGWTKASGDTRALLIDEAMSLLIIGRNKLESLSGASRSTLPGNARNSWLSNPWISKLISGNGIGNTAKELVNSTAKSLISSTVSAITGSNQVQKDNPINRPNFDKTTGETVTESFEKGNNLGESSSEKKKGGILNGLLSTITGKNNLGTYSFRTNYLNGIGICSTLSELAMHNGKSTSPENISSVENLFNILKEGDYITSPYKFNQLWNPASSNLTLDTNSYWEIIFEPFVGPENGNFSYLPAFHEMDTINETLHGVKTVHGPWIPFLGFELAKSRLATKSLGLYDGEVVYPISAEMTNELRLTIADDAYKSWRGYFQKCMDVSIYSSMPHDKDYYTDGIGSVTVVDKTSNIVAFYKNLAFQIKIYVLTPQYSVIRDFNFLCVLREFSEEYIGEADTAPGTDLSLSFSIVGENPISSGKGNAQTRAAVAQQRLQQSKDMRDSRISQFNESIKKQIDSSATKLNVEMPSVKKYTDASAFGGELKEKIVEII